MGPIYKDPKIKYMAPYWYGTPFRKDEGGPLVILMIQLKKAK